MGINFDKLPAKKPNENSSIEPGRYLAKIDKAEILVGKDSGAQYLAVIFKTKDAGSMRESFFDGEKPFLQYKLGRLIHAAGVTLEGTGTLQDVSKVIVGKKVIIDVAVNDRGYSNLDFTSNKEGLYATDEVVIEEVDSEPEVDEDIEAAVASEDEDF